MTDAIEQIINGLNEALVEIDAETLAKAQEWAKQRVAKIAKFKATNNIREMGTWKYYGALFALAGGKTWYNILYGRTHAQIEEFMIKNHDATIAKRNATIARKLSKENITSVLSSNYSRSEDGFNGFFSVETDKGQRSIKIETISAGGYNIQCWHLRTLVHVF